MLCRLLSPDREFALLYTKFTLSLSFLCISHVHRYPCISFRPGEEFLHSKLYQSLITASPTTCLNRISVDVWRVFHSRLAIVSHLLARGGISLLNFTHMPAVIPDGKDNIWG